MESSNHTIKPEAAVSSFASPSSSFRKPQPQQSPSSSSSAQPHRKASMVAASRGSSFTTTTNTLAASFSSAASGTTSNGGLSSSTDVMASEATTLHNNNKHIPASMRNMVEECDYDKAPTVLYKAIERKAWDQVLQLLADDEEDDDSDDDDNDNENSSEESGGGLNRHGAKAPTTKTATSVSANNNNNNMPNLLKPRTPQQEAAVWVVRKEPDGRLRWRLLPLHAALIFNAPLSIIEVLLKVYPKAAALKDDQGMTPLHLACRQLPTPNFYILEELLTSHPAAVYVKDRKGRTPLQAGLAANATTSTTNGTTNASTSATTTPPTDPLAAAAASTAAALSVMELYTQIAAAGEKQRWRTEHEQQAKQQLQLLHDQHQAQIASIKSEYEEQLATQHKKLALHQGSLAAQLKATQLQYEMTLQQLHNAQERERQQQERQQQEEFRRQQQQQQQVAEVAREPPHPHNVSLSNASSDQSHTLSSNSVEEVAQLQRTNRQLQGLLEVLLDQHASLQESWRTLQADQSRWHEERNVLLRQYLEKSERSVATSQAHTALWQDEFAKTQDMVQGQLHTMGLWQVQPPREPQESSPRSNNIAKHSSEEKNEAKTTTNVSQSNQQHENDTTVEEKKTQDPEERHKNSNNSGGAKDTATSTQSSYRNPAAVILSNHGAEVLP